jgi:hypothetical protein
MGAHRKQSFMLLGIPDISKKVDYDPDLSSILARPLAVSPELGSKELHSRKKGHV